MLLVGGVVEEDYYQDTGDKQEAEQYDYITEVATPTVLQYEAGTMKWGAGPSLPSPLQVGLHIPAKHQQNLNDFIDSSTT